MPGIKQAKRRKNPVLPPKYPFSPDSPPLVRWSGKKALKIAQRFSAGFPEANRAKSRKGRQTSAVCTLAETKPLLSFAPGSLAFLTHQSPTLMRRTIYVYPASQEVGNQSIRRFDPLSVARTIFPKSGTEIASNRAEMHITTKPM
jgi:hypothetical protein